MVSDVYFPRINGVSTAIQTYREALPAHGVEVTLIAPNYGAGCSESWITRVPARPVPGDLEDRLAHWRAMHRAVDAAVAAGCDLVHIQTPFVAHYAASRSARRHGVPVIATYHTLFEEYVKHYVPIFPSPLLRALARGFSRRQCNALDAVIVPSRAIHERLERYGVSVPLHVLPTGIPIDGATTGERAAFRSRHGISERRPVALFVGRVAYEKNIEFLIEVVDLARRVLPALLLVVAGEGPALPSLARAVSARRLEGNVKFIGYLDRQRELPACYAAADVFVFASRTETQGLVLLEAMAAGLPVVALAAMGTIDILAARRGAVVADDDRGAFAQALVSLLCDPARRARLAGEARGYAAEWSDDALAAKMAELYRQTAARFVKTSARALGLAPR
jgi:glycosyltransferase involved in cell wall biosynthesis